VDEIGLFPLGIVLLPTEQIPLHIFEERYKELIGECLERDEEFGLVLADDDGIRDVGTRAAVIEVIERLDDGRLNIVVEGRERFRLRELTQGRAFHTGDVEAVEDQQDPADPADAEEALRLFATLVELTGAEVETPEPDHPVLSFAIAARFELAPDVKQQLLQATSERERMKQVCEILARAAETVERQREIAARAQGNGRAHPPGDR
jgi:Lon protease-like protein